MYLVDRLACGLPFTQEGFLTSAVGTICCFVRDANSDDATIYALTAGHCVDLSKDPSLTAAQRFMAGSIVDKSVYPADWQSKLGGFMKVSIGKADGTVFVGQRRPISTGKSTGIAYGVDVGLIRLRQDFWDISRWNNYVWNIGNIKGVRDLTKEVVQQGKLRVQKRGAITECTAGYIESTTAETSGLSNVMSISLADPGISDRNCFAEQGDSGAPVVTDDGNLVGMIYAVGNEAKNGRRLAYAVHIQPALDQLGMRLAAPGSA